MIVEGGRSACAASRPTRKELNGEVSIGMSLTFDVTSARALINPSFPPSTWSNGSCAPQVLLLVTPKYTSSRAAASLMMRDRTPPSIARFVWTPPLVRREAVLRRNQFGGSICRPSFSILYFSINFSM